MRPAYSRSARCVQREDETLTPRSTTGNPSTLLASRSVLTTAAPTVKAVSANEDRSRPTAARRCEALIEALIALVSRK